MKKEYKTEVNSNGDTVIATKSEEIMTIEDLYYIFHKLLQEGKGSYGVNFEGWSSAIGEITIDDNIKHICLD